VSERWIVIPRWEEFQHYADRDPVWIKVYSRLMSDDAFRDLTFHQRGVLVSLWIEYARSGRQLRDSTVTLTRQLGHRVMTRDLDALIRAGFITFSASAPLAQSKNKSKSKKELSKDQRRAPTEAELVREREQAEIDKQRGNGWVENLNAYTGCRIVRGEVGISHKYDPLGTEHPPENWPHPRPTKAEVLDALARKTEHHVA
jgi:hypothetical protein